MTSRTYSTGTVEARFSNCAPLYEREAVVQSEAAIRIAEWCLEGSAPASILDVGCGTGRLTRLLREGAPAAKFTALDPAPGMIAEAQRRCGDGIRWLTGTVADLDTSDRFECIASNCALHWSADLAGDLIRLHAAGVPGTTLTFSVMLEGTLAELHAIRRSVVPEVPPCGRLPAEADIQSALEAASWRIRRHDDRTFRIIEPNARSLIQRLRAQGVTGGAFSQGVRTLTRGELDRFYETYDRAYAQPGGVQVTYRIGFYQADRA